MGLLSSLVVTSYRLPVVTIGLSCRFRYDLSRTDRRTGIDLAKGDTMSQKQKMSFCWIVIMFTLSRCVNL